MKTERLEELRALALNPASQVVLINDQDLLTELLDEIERFRLPESSDDAVRAHESKISVERCHELRRIAQGWVDGTLLSVSINGGELAKGTLQLLGALDCVETANMVVWNAYGKFRRDVRHSLPKPGNMGYTDEDVVSDVEAMRNRLALLEGTGCFPRVDDDDGTDCVLMASDLPPNVAEDDPPFKIGDLVTSSFLDNYAYSDEREAERKRVRKVTMVKRNSMHDSGWEVKADAGGGDIPCPPFRSGINSGYFTRVEVIEEP